MEMNIFILKKEGGGWKENCLRRAFKCWETFFSFFRYWGGCCLQRILEFYGVTFRGSDKDNSHPGVTNGPKI